MGAHSARVTCHVSWAPRIVEGCTVNVPPSALWGSPVVGLPHAKHNNTVAPIILSPTLARTGGTKKVVSHTFDRESDHRN